MAIFKCANLVSDEDVLLRELEAKRADLLTTNQQREINKHQKIAKRRDLPGVAETDSLWRDF
jgi:hypothetical protein